MARHDHTRTVAGSRPACSAASFTAVTQRTSVSSVKNVCSTTWSKARPPSASECGPNAMRAERDVLVEVGIEAQERIAAGRPVVADDGLAPPQPAHQPGEVLQLGGGDRGQAERAPSAARCPGPGPRVKRPPVRRCMVVAYDAVTIGWRVLWLVAPVAMLQPGRHRARRRPTAWPPP